MAQPQLNGAYYGPAIPPPDKSHRHRPSRDCCGGCCCLGSCLRCCCGCIFDLIFSIICKLLCTVLVLVAVSAVIFWFIVRPNVLKVHVTSAALTQFNLTDSINSSNNRTLHYNLALNVTIRNPNKRVGIYYDYVEARALYHDSEFASRALDPFFQHPKNTTELATSFKGANDVVLGEGKGEKVHDEEGSGVYGIDLKVDMKVRFKLGLVKTGKVKAKIRCELKVPLAKAARNGTAAAAAEFQDTPCDWGYRWIWFH